MRELLYSFDLRRSPSTACRYDGQQAYPILSLIFLRYFGPIAYSVHGLNFVKAQIGRLVSVLPCVLLVNVANSLSAIDRRGEASTLCSQVVTFDCE